MGSAKGKGDKKGAINGGIPQQEDDDRVQLYVENEINKLDPRPAGSPSKEEYFPKDESPKPEASEH